MDESRKAAQGAGERDEDPEIAALLDFEPVPRKFKRPDGWSPALQREFIRLLAESGSPAAACEVLGKNRHGIEKLYKSPGAESFRAAWDRAVEIAQERAAASRAAAYRDSAGLRAPFVDRRRKEAEPGPLPGQLMNEHGEWEDGDSLRERVGEARESVSAKLLRCRRAYLAEIAPYPGKRAAFEILTELPIDWEKAAAMEEQVDEPFRPPNFRKADMVLTAENGWLGDLAFGRNRMAEARAAMNEELIAKGEEPIDWGESIEDFVEGGGESSEGADTTEDETGERGNEPTTSSPTPIGDPASHSPKPNDKPGPRVRRV